MEPWDIVTALTPCILCPSVALENVQTSTAQQRHARRAASAAHGAPFVVLVVAPQLKGQVHLQAGSMSAHVAVRVLRAVLCTQQGKSVLGGYCT